MRDRRGPPLGVPGLLRHARRRAPGRRRRRLAGGLRLLRAEPRGAAARTRARDPVCASAHTPVGGGVACRPCRSSRRDRARRAVDAGLLGPAADLPGALPRRATARASPCGCSARRPFVMVSDPEEIKQVFTAPPDVLHPGEGARLLEPIVGPRSVILLDEKPHMEQRKLMLPAFHGERMAALDGPRRARSPTRGRALADRRAGRAAAAPPGADARGRPARGLRPAARCAPRHAARAAVRAARLGRQPAVGPPRAARRARPPRPVGALRPRADRGRRAPLRGHRRAPRRRRRGRRRPRMLLAARHSTTARR